MRLQCEQGRANSLPQRAKKILTQFKEVKILHVHRVTNAQADALTGLVASLSVQIEVRHIMVAGRLLTPLPEMLRQPHSEGS